MAADPIFSPSFGNRPSKLVGREPVLAELLAGLGSVPGSRDRAVVLLGQRGSGKTVLLWELAERASDAGFVVATPTIASDGMLERIVEKIQDAGESGMDKRKLRLAGGNLGALGFSAGLQFTREVQESKSFQHKLTQLARALSKQGKGILVLVDELQANSPEIRQLVIAYQELVGEGLNIAMVMAGLPGAVSATLNDKVLTFLNRARKTELGPLSFADVDAFYKDSFERLGLSLSSDLRRTASHAVNGSPYLLQLIGHNMALYSPEGGALDEESVGEALRTAQEDYENDVCKTTLAALSARDVDFLHAMVEVGVPTKMADVAKAMGESPDYAQKYRRRLMDSGIILSPERGKVSFAVPYLEEYLRARV